MQNAINRVILGAIIALAVFVALVHWVPLDTLIMFLNGAFFGTAAAILVAYGRLLWNAILGVRPYDRVRQMTLGFFLCWVAYGLGVAISFYYRSTGTDINSSMLTAASRYVAVIAAVLQVTAPDFGLGIFHGRDRRVLYTGLAAGLITAFVTVLFQTEQVFAP